MNNAANESPRVDHHVPYLTRFLNDEQFRTLYDPSQSAERLEYSAMENYPLTGQVHRIQSADFDRYIVGLNEELGINQSATLQFNTGSADLFPRNDKALSQRNHEAIQTLVDGYQHNPGNHVLTHGFASALGDFAHNQSLSERRVTATIDALVAAHGGTSTERKAFREKLTEFAEAFGESKTADGKERADASVETDLPENRIVRVVTTGHDFDAHRHTVVYPVDLMGHVPHTLQPQSDDNGAIIDREGFGQQILLPDRQADAVFLTQNPIDAHQPAILRFTAASDDIADNTTFSIMSRHDDPDLTRVSAYYNPVSHQVVMLDGEHIAGRIMIPEHIDPTRLKFGSITRDDEVITVELDNLAELQAAKSMGATGYEFDTPYVRAVTNAIHANPELEKLLTEPAYFGPNTGMAVERLIRERAQDGTLSTQDIDAIYALGESFTTQHAQQIVDSAIRQQVAKEMTQSQQDRANPLMPDIWAEDGDLEQEDMDAALQRITAQMQQSGITVTDTTITNEPGTVGDHIDVSWQYEEDDRVHGSTHHNLYLRGLDGGVQSDVPSR